MKNLLGIVAWVGVVFLATGCSLFSSREVPPVQPAPVGASTPIPISSGAMPPTACQSRLWGKVTNTGTNQPPANASIEVVSGGKTYKTITDPNGLYGFAGLCAGEYSMTLTPGGGQALQNPNKVKLDGTNPVKVDLPYR